MAWSGEESAYDKLYDRLFSVYGQNPDDIGIGETQPNFEANYVDNLAQQMGGDYDQWSTFLTGDHGGTFDPKDYFRGGAIGLLGGVGRTSRFLSPFAKKSKNTLKEAKKILKDKDLLARAENLKAVDNLTAVTAIKAAKQTIRELIVM